MSSDNKKYGTRKYLTYNEWMKLPAKRQMEELKIISASVNRSLTSIEKSAERHGIDPELSSALTYVKRVFGTSRITSDKQASDPTTAYQVAYHIIHNIKGNTSQGFIKEVTDKRRILIASLERNRKNLEKLRIQQLKSIKGGESIKDPIDDMLSSADLKEATKSLKFDKGVTKDVAINLNGKNVIVTLNSTDMLSTIGHMLNILREAAEEAGYGYGKAQRDRNEVVKALSRYLFSKKNYSVEDAMNLALNDILSGVKSHKADVATTGERSRRFSHIKIGGSRGGSTSSSSGKVRVSSQTRDIGGRVNERL